MDAEIGRIYGNRVRVRVCGLCWHGGKLLMVRHSSINNGVLWSPPGGGIEFGKTAHETLVSEFEQESKIDVEPGRFLFACEYINAPLHAVELFFEVFYKSGNVGLGFDPEMVSDKQIIQEVCWLSSEQIKSIANKDLHGIFELCSEPDDLMKMTGYWRI